MDDLRKIVISNSRKKFVVKFIYFIEQFSLIPFFFFLFQFYQVLISNTWIPMQRTFLLDPFENKASSYSRFIFFFFVFSFRAASVYIYIYISSNVTIDSWLTLEIPRHIKMKRSGSNCRHCQYRNTIENTQSLSARAFKGNPSRYNLR